MKDSKNSPEEMDFDTIAETENTHHLEGDAFESNGNHGARQKAKEQAHEVKEQFRDRADQVRDDITSQAKEMGERGRGTLSQKILHCEKAMQAAAEQLRNDGEDDIADYVGSFAGSCNNANDYINDCSVDRVVNDVSRQVSKHPALFFGGLFVTGLALTRFLKATEPRPEPEVGYDSYQGPSPAYDAGSPRNGNGHRY